MEEIKNVVDEEDIEKICFSQAGPEYLYQLKLAHERYKKSQLLFDEAQTLKKTQPFQAVKLLYEAYELNSNNDAEAELFRSTAPDHSTDERITKDESAEELFYRGLQALSGIGRLRNEKSAAQYLRYAAEKNYAPAQARLAELLHHGKAGLKQDFLEAIKWMQRAANQGYAHAQAYLGMAYTSGNWGTKQNKNEALLWFERAALQNDTTALCYLALGFPNPLSLGLPVNYKEAFRNYRLIARQNPLLGVHHLTRLYTSANTPFYAENILEHCYDFYVLKINEVRNYLARCKHQTEDFTVHYYVQRMSREWYVTGTRFKKHLDKFFEELQKDPFIDKERRGYLFLYLGETQIHNLYPKAQVLLAEKLYAQGAITPALAIKIIKILRIFPQNTQHYAKAMHLAWKLTLLIDKNSYLAEYYLREYLRVKPEDKVLHEKELMTEWDDLAISYCKAEIDFSDEDFKRWLKAKIRQLESCETPLSSSELHLLHEFYFRLAKIKYEKSQAFKFTQGSLIAKITSWLLWSQPEPPQITPIIGLLKNIPAEHIRFEEAQFLIRECREHFKDSLQNKPENIIVGIKLGRGKQD